MSSVLFNQISEVNDELIEKIGEILEDSEDYLTIRPSVCALIRPSTPRRAMIGTPSLGERFIDILEILFDDSNGSPFWLDDISKSDNGFNKFEFTAIGNFLDYKKNWELRLNCLLLFREILKDFEVANDE